jgi:hypothetical protein
MYETYKFLNVALFLTYVTFTKRISAQNGNFTGCTYLLAHGLAGVDGFLLYLMPCNVYVTCCTLYFMKQSPHFETHLSQVHFMFCDV